MIIFDRFLCCIKLKSFGKFVGWTGLVISVFLAYAIFLVLTGKKTTSANSNFYDNTRFQHLSIFCIALLLIAALFHVLLIYGIKFVSEEFPHATHISHRKKNFTIVFSQFFFAAQVSSHRAISHSLDRTKRYSFMHPSLANSS